MSELQTSIDRAGAGMEAIQNTWHKEMGVRFDRNELSMFFEGFEPMEFSFDQWLRDNEESDGTHESEASAF